MLTFLQNACVIARVLTFSPSHPTLIFLPAVLIFLPFSVISIPWQQIQIADKSWRMCNHPRNWLLAATDNGTVTRCDRSRRLFQLETPETRVVNPSERWMRGNRRIQLLRPVQKRRHLCPLPLQTTCYVYSATCWENQGNTSFLFSSSSVLN
jgi:hypothetical protein